MMRAVVVKQSFWTNPVVQHLRMMCEEDVTFRQSLTVLADVVFPFSGAIAFCVLYPDKLNEGGISEIEEVARHHQTVAVIVCLSADQSQLYGSLLAAIPVAVSAIVCFEEDGFAKNAAEFMWETASKVKQMRRKIDRLIEEKRKSFMDADVQGPRIFEGLIKDVRERAKLIRMLNTETGTIRETLVKGIPELLDRDFFIEAGE